MSGWLVGCTFVTGYVVSYALESLGWPLWAILLTCVFLGVAIGMADWTVRRRREAGGES